MPSTTNRQLTNPAKRGPGPRCTAPRTHEWMPSAPRTRSYSAGSAVRERGRGDRAVRMQGHHCGAEPDVDPVRRISCSSPRPTARQGATPAQKDCRSTSNSSRPASSRNCCCSIARARSWSGGPSPSAVSARTELPGRKSPMPACPHADVRSMTSHSIPRPARARAPARPAIPPPTTSARRRRTDISCSRPVTPPARDPVHRYPGPRVPAVIPRLRRDGARRRRRWPRRAR